MNVATGAAEGAPLEAAADPEAGPLPPGVLVARVGAGANCSSAGSAIDILFYTSVIAGAVAVALSAAFPPRPAVAVKGGAARTKDEADPGDDPDEQTR